MAQFYRNPHTIYNEWDWNVDPDGFHYVLLDPKGDSIAFTNPEIVTCAFGNEANLIGALAFHLQQRS